MRELKYLEMTSNQFPDDSAGININYNVKSEDNELPVKIIILGDSASGTFFYSK